MPPVSSVISEVRQAAQLERRPRWVRWLRKPLVDKLYDLASAKWCGNQVPPMAEKTIHKWDVRGEEYRVIAFADDGGEVGIGWGHEWQAFVKRSEWHRAAMSYLRIWVFSDRCGLRTKLYFWCLKKRCDRIRSFQYRPAR
jgi:hypothetical protein